MLGIVPEPWEVTDPMASTDFLLFTFGSSGGHEIANANRLLDLLEKLDPEDARDVFNDLLPLWDDGHFATIGGRGPVPKGKCQTPDDVGQHGDFYCDPILFSLDPFAAEQMAAIGITPGPCAGEEAGNAVPGGGVSIFGEASIGKWPRSFDQLPDGEG